MKLKTDNKNGSALFIGLVAAAILAGAVAATFELTTTTALTTDRSRDRDSIQAAGEGVLDYMYGIWRQGMRNASDPLSTSAAQALFASMPALPAGSSYVGTPTITCVDAFGQPISTPVAVAGISNNPRGWPSSVYAYLAVVQLRAEGPKGVPVNVVLRRTFQHELISPVAGLFYTEGDFELYKPAPMIIGGNVHTNGKGYVSTHYSNSPDRLRFDTTSSISFVDTYAHAIPPGAESWSAAGPNDVQAPTYDRGYDQQVSQADEVEGIGLGTSAEFDTTDANPNNDGNRELIEPPNPSYADPAGIAEARVYNNAGLIVEVSGPINSSQALSAAGSNTYTASNLKIQGKNGTTVTAAQASAIKAGLSNSTTVTVTEDEVYWDASARRWRTRTVTRTQVVQKTLYDKREGTTAGITDVDVGAVRPTLQALSGFNGILYIQDTGSTGPSDPKAIRLKNGGVLPTNGLTVATQNGLYVQGDYNTGTTTNPNSVPSNNGGNPNNTDASYASGYSPVPAALVADAVMVLSNNWSDSNASSSLSSRAATNTTLNTAIVAGYIPSLWTNPNTGDNYGYSGGMNNFPRFLETWSGDYLTFYGAFVQLFKSETFIGEWDTADIYAPPARRWNFDTLLLERVIPGIPRASSFGRGRIQQG